MDRNKNFEIIYEVNVDELEKIFEEKGVAAKFKQITKSADFIKALNDAIVHLKTHWENAIKEFNVVEFAGEAIDEKVFKRAVYLNIKKIALGDASKYIVFNGGEVEEIIPKMMSIIKSIQIINWTLKYALYECKDAAERALYDLADSGTGGFLN